MSVEDKLESIMSELRSIRKTTEKLEERINGNGRAGVFERIVSVETRISEAEKNKSASVALGTAILSALGVVASLFLGK